MTSSFGSSLFSLPQPPLGYIWAPTTIRGATWGSEDGALSSEVERSFLMGASGKHELPKVRIMSRPSPSQSQTFEPPCVLVASSDTNAGQFGPFAAMPGEILWEEIPSIVFPEQVHLPSLTGGVNSNQKGNAPSVGQGLAAVWSMMTQKASAPPLDAKPQSMPTANTFATLYGRGFSAIATGLMTAVDDTEVTINASFQGAVAALGFTQAAAVQAEQRSEARSDRTLSQLMTPTAMGPGIGVASPVLQLERYFATQDAATVPAALMTMIGKVLEGPKGSDTSNLLSRGRDVFPPLGLGASVLACFWRLCQERSLILLKDPDGVPQGEGLGDNDNVGPSAPPRESIAAFCPLAAMANFTKIAAIANAQLILVQQAMPIRHAINNSVEFKYRFVLQAVATRPIRRGEEIRLPVGVLCSSSATASGTETLVARPSVGLASSSHLTAALKLIAEAIQRNPSHKRNGNMDSETEMPEGANPLGRIPPIFTNSDYQRHLERARASLEDLLRQRFGAYLGSGQASRAKANSIMAMLQQAAAKQNK